jgi:hypothetical protein
LIHNPRLIEALEKFETRSFEGDVFRATRRSLDPTTVSFIGCDGLIAPSANLAMDVTITPKNVEEVDWQVWADANMPNP